MTKIKDLPRLKQPREKLLSQGSHNLSDADLLAIILGTGQTKKNALVIARNLLKHYPLSKLSQISLTDLTQFNGIGPSKASRIMAALELGSRIFAPSTLGQTIIHTTEEMLKEFTEIADKKQEHIMVLYLNARNQLMQKETVAVGNLNSSLIEPREIFAPAVKTPCAGIVMAHNHPSADPTPSREDIIFTKRVQAAGEILGIPLLDHLIICSQGYFSFKEGVK